MSEPSGSPYMLHYLTTVLRLCPQGSRTCEIGIGTSHGAVWLSLRGVDAEGIDRNPASVERARQVNNALGGRASFRVGDLFRFYQRGRPRYQVVHHQGVLEHFAVPWIRALLAQQVASAHRTSWSYNAFDRPVQRVDAVDPLGRQTTAV